MAQEQQRGLTVQPRRDITTFDDGDVFSVAKAFVESGYFGDTKSIAQAVVKILAGREAGFGPMASIMGIHIVQGKPVYSANMVATSVKRSPRYSYRVAKLDDEGCTIGFFETGKPIGDSSFTIKDAQKANLMGRDNWKAYPRNMCFARALTNGVKWYCPDVFGGIDADVVEDTNTDAAEREKQDLEARRVEGALYAPPRTPAHPFCVVDADGVIDEGPLGNVDMAEVVDEEVEGAEPAGTLFDEPAEPEDPRAAIIAEQVAKWVRTWQRKVLKEADKPRFWAALQKAIQEGTAESEVLDQVKAQVLPQ